MATINESPPPVTPRRLTGKGKRQHLLNENRRQQIAGCFMAIVMGLMLALFTLPSLPSYQGPHAGPFALMGFAVSVVLLVCLWRSFGEEP